CSFGCVLEEVEATERDRLGGLGVDWRVIEGDLAGVGIDLYMGEAVVVDHRCQADGAGAAYADPAGPGRPVVIAGPGRGLADEGDRQVSRGRAVRTELGAEHERLRELDGRIRVTDNAVGREASLENKVRFGAEVLRPPEHDVGKLADLQRSDLVGQAV